MRIGVDVTALAQQTGGIGRYTEELVSRMVEFGHSWYLYSHGPLARSCVDRGNVVLRHGNLRGRAVRLVWSQTVMPVMVRRDGVEVFWGPGHRLPVLLPRGVARVVTIHDLVWNHAADTMRPLGRWVDSVFMPQAVNAADRVIAVSEHTAADVEEAFPACAGKTRTIHLGVSRALTVQRGGSLSALGVDGAFFLFVGTLEPRKNLARLLAAYSRLPMEVRSRASLVVAGNTGWGRVDYNRLLDQLGLRPHVRLLGWVSDEELGQLYAHAQFLAMPSLYEGFGLPLIEAMSYGVPVLTSNTASMPEVAGAAGVLVDPYCVASISTGLHRLLTDECVRLELSRLAGLNAQRFSWDRAAAATMCVLEEALVERKAKCA